MNIHQKYLHSHDTGYYMCRENANSFDAYSFNEKLKILKEKLRVLSSKIAE